MTDLKTVKVDDLQNTLINNALVYLYYGIHDEDTKEQLLKLIKKFEFFSPDQE